MKIRIYSDLHLEFVKELPKLSLPPVDLVILAGDIHQGVAGIRWAKETFKDQPVVYVMGNHEYYHGDLVSTLADARNEAIDSNVHLLEQDALELPGVTVLGCTLWTDFRLLGRSQEATCRSAAMTYLSDYRLISFCDRDAHPSDTQLISAESYLWLDQQIQKATKPVIAVTHHAPSLQMNNPYYDIDATTASFASNYDALLRAPVKLWVWGHVHHCFDYRHEGIRFISNQKGYRREGIEGFAWEHVFDVAI